MGSCGFAWGVSCIVERGGRERESEMCKLFKQVVWVRE